jgi:hypothetical protein
MCLQVSYMKKYASLKSLKKGEGTGVGAGSGSIIRGTVTDPQHCVKESLLNSLEGLAVRLLTRCELLYGRALHYPCSFSPAKSPPSVSGRESNPGITELFEESPQDVRAKSNPLTCGRQLR